jgi:calcium-dependent protein kinase
MAFNANTVDVLGCSPRVDQRKSGNNKEEEKKNPLVAAMEKKLYTKYAEQLEKSRLNIVINPRMMVSERRNPIEINYEILEIIGKGGFGEVKKVRHKELDVIRALKVIKKQKYKTPAEIKMIKNEIAVMKLVDHPNIVKLFEFFEDDDYFYIITEYCSGGQLFEMIRQKKKFTENEAAQIMQ